MGINALYYCDAACLTSPTEGLIYSSMLTPNKELKFDHHAWYKWEEEAKVSRATWGKAGLTGPCIVWTHLLLAEYET